jgi:hypothetical protein
MFSTLAEFRLDKSSLLSVLGGLAVQVFLIASYEHANSAKKFILNITDGVLS